MMKKEILQDLDGDDLTPPPYWIMTRLPPRAPPGSEAALTPDSGPGEVPAAAAALPPALLEFIELPIWQAPIPAMETSGQRPQNSTSAGPPRLYPPLPVSTNGKGEGNIAIRHRLHSAKEQGEGTDAPQRATAASRSGRMGHYHQPPAAYYYQPFSSTDILNWQRHAPPYSGELQAMIRPMETIFRTHRPT